MSETTYRVLYAGVEYFTKRDPELKTHLANKAPSLTITDVRGIERTLSITDGVPIVVSQYPARKDEPRGSILE